VDLKLVVEISDYWELWNSFRFKGQHKSQLSVALDVQSSLSSINLIRRWYVEHVKAAIVHTEKRPRHMFMRHEINSVMELIPESLRVAMKAHFASQYKEAKSLFVTRIGDSRWAKRELKNMSHSKSTQSNNFYIQQDVRVQNSLHCI
ncbi:protein arginine N-methyltransferase 1.5, partial [Tanacetum coccineum]